MHSTNEGRPESSGLADIFRVRRVKRLDIMSEDDRFMKGVVELKTEVIIAVSAF